jgi:hypothetical protein
MSNFASYAFADCVSCLFSRSFAGPVVNSQGLPGLCEIALVFAQPILMTEDAM